MEPGDLTVEGKARRANRLLSRGSQDAFFVRVWQLVQAIPRGQVATYGELARALGTPRAARVVGWALRACGADVPWHRVVNARGMISWRPTGGYQRQRRRLKREGVQFDRTGRINLRKFGWQGLPRRAHGHPQGQ